MVVLRETKLSSVMTRQVAEAICLEHDTRADGTLDYGALCDDIFPGDFDHYAHQEHFVYKVSSKPSNVLLYGCCFSVLYINIVVAALAYRYRTPKKLHHVDKKKHTTNLAPRPERKKKVETRYKTTTPPSW